MDQKLPHVDAEAVQVSVNTNFNLKTNGTEKQSILQTSTPWGQENSDEVEIERLVENLVGKVDSVIEAENKIMTNNEKDKTLAKELSKNPFEETVMDTVEVKKIAVVNNFEQDVESEEGTSETKKSIFKKLVDNVMSKVFWKKQKKTEDAAAESSSTSVVAETVSTAPKITRKAIDDVLSSLKNDIMTVALAIVEKSDGHGPRNVSKEREVQETFSSLETIAKSKFLINLSEMMKTLKISMNEGKMVTLEEVQMSVDSVIAITRAAIKEMHPSDTEACDAKEETANKGNTDAIRKDEEENETDG